MSWFSKRVELEEGERLIILDPGKGQPKNIPGKVKSILPWKWGRKGEPSMYPGYEIECDDGVDRQLTDQSYYLTARGVKVQNGRACPPPPRRGRR